MANVSKYLTHVGQYFVAELDQWTDVKTPTDITTVNCFTYFGESTRLNAGIEGGHAFSQRLGWFTILPSTFHHVTVGDRLDHIVDNKKVVVRGEGRVEEMVVYRHHRKGIQFIQVRLNDN